MKYRKHIKVSRDTENGGDVIRLRTESCQALCGYSANQKAYVAFFKTRQGGQMIAVSLVKQKRDSLDKIEAYATRKIKQIERRI